MLRELISDKLILRIPLIMVVLVVSSPLLYHFRT